MDDSLRGKLDFIFFTARLREVERHNNATRTRKESVAEHSWHLALVSWILQREFERELGHALDLEKMLRMCLMHDLVEIDAGDPSAWGSQLNGTDKVRIEEDVAQHRFSPLPDGLGAEFLALWHEAQGLTSHPLLAHPRHHPHPMVASLDGQGPTLRAPGPDRRGHHRTRHRPLSPKLTNYR
ncbi:HD domain-containing protein [Streptomyces sp. DR7-3]|uniref:HD domain-containing protein n=1 Tax=Streptomyces sp. DR7-3 TaxID=2951170 RepID=UPI002044694D|nr:HD domain-containing protein [Streptomyces sp. DR7-3]MCM3809273.1 HD domain-containing protein [Streptomyces sp. DR7-3]